MRLGKASEETLELVDGNCSAHNESLVSELCLVEELHLRNVNQDVKILVEDGRARVPDHELDTLAAVELKESVELVERECGVPEERRVADGDDMRQERGLGAGLVATQFLDVRTLSPVAGEVLQSGEDWPVASASAQIPVQSAGELF